MTPRSATLRAFMGVTLLFGLPLTGQNSRPTVHAAAAFESLHAPSHAVATHLGAVTPNQATPAWVD
jgi:hypothetical protein